MVEINCINCGRTFKIKDYLLNKQKLCSRKCFFEYARKNYNGIGNPFYGKKHSQETRDRISRANIGNIAWNKGKEHIAVKGNKNPAKRWEVRKKLRERIITSEMRRAISDRLKGKSKSDEHKKKISATLTGRKNPEHSRRLLGKPQPWHRGENNNFWKGGLSKINGEIKNSIEFKGFIRKVYYRDNYSCLKCKKCGKLNVHHLKNFSQYPQLRMIVSNGKTLCLECHRLFHKKYGIKNNNVIQYKEFLLV